ncbi:hypothetical protein [Longimicrobium sp.]|uniref:hypothetical protein n=1 Tax=Longimicrobium sp. TaxID=2029185 RepID=UPI003B3BADA2
MANPFSNRKKVRGWKRRIRQLERLRLRHRELDLELLRRDRVEYVEILLDPWSRLVPRNPPYWYRRRILAAFIDIFDAWRETLERQGEPYYLALWVLEPNFHGTQVVAATGDRIEGYRTRFDFVERGSAGPVQYRDESYDLGRFQWRAGQLLDVFSAREDAFDEFDVADWTRTADRIEQTADDTLFTFKRGIVWLGTQPSELSPALPVLPEVR